MVALVAEETPRMVLVSTSKWAKPWSTHIIVPTHSHIGIEGVVEGKERAAIVKCR